MGYFLNILAQVPWQAQQLQDFFLVLSSSSNQPSYFFEVDFHVQTSGGRVDLMKLLVEAGADVNHGSFPPLVVAAQKGHLEVVRFLVEKGADIGKPNDYGLTAMRSADLAQQAAVVQYLLKVKHEQIFLDSCWSSWKCQWLSIAVNLLPTHGSPPFFVTGNSDMNLVLFESFASRKCRFGSFQPANDPTVRRSFQTGLQLPLEGRRLVVPSFAHGKCVPNHVKLLNKCSNWLLKFAATVFQWGFCWKSQSQSSMLSAQHFGFNYLDKAANGDI